MVTLQFHIAIEALPKDSKTNVWNVKSIAEVGEDDVIYLLPLEAQLLKSHTELSKHPTIAHLHSSMNLRSEQRRVKIKLTEELKKIYLDDEGNIIFGTYHLKEVWTAESNTGAVEQNQTSWEDGKRLLQSIMKDIVCEKYGSKSVG